MRSVRVSAGAMALSIFKARTILSASPSLSLLDLGASTVTGTGRVYNLNNLSDFSGNYVATQATFAVAGGAGELTMTNARGVVISLSSQESGTQLTAGPSGISLKLK